MDSTAFVFLDETGATTNMVRRYGWGARGERLVDAAPQGHWRTTTFVAGLRHDGIIAPFVLDGPMTGDAFRAYVEQVLAKALSPGDVVVMDNLAAHKVAGVAEAVIAAGASILYLPPCSPDRPQSAGSSTSSPHPNARTTSKTRICVRLTCSKIRTSTLQVSRLPGAERVRWLPDQIS